MDHVQISQIQTSLAKMNGQSWSIYLGWLRSFQIFIDQAIVQMADSTGTDSTKITLHRERMAQCFDLFDNWHADRKPIVKARRNEIDSAISFLRNTAMQTGIRNTHGAACARNLTNALRSALHLSNRSYSTEDYPFIMANSLFSIAAVRAIFPADTADFVQFLKPGENIVAGTFQGKPVKANIDILLVMIDRGCEQLNIPDNYKRLQAELKYIQDNIMSPPKSWHMPEGLWTSQKTSLMADLHYGGRQEFLHADT